jgi:hypothetical protein
MNGVNPGSGSVYVDDIQTLLEINVQAKRPLQFEWIKKHSVGSRYTCFPPPLNTDEDTLFYVQNDFNSVDILKQLGWTEDFGETYKMHGSFFSMRKDDQNYIITSDIMFYDCFCAAARICKTLNIMDKKLRVWVHNEVMGIIA